jgi:hypothetical protein
VQGSFGFVRRIIARNVDCSSAYALVQAWAIATFDPDGAGAKDTGAPSQVGQFTCVNKDPGGENPALEAVCGAADGRAVAFLAAS